MLLGTKLPTFKKADEAIFYTTFIYSLFAKPAVY